MADGFQRLISLVRSRHPEITGAGSLEWSSKNSGFRENIRASIQETLKTGDGAAISDLETPPRPLQWSVSISHSAQFGGWLAIHLPARIGFDIEDSARIRKEVIERMSTPQEIAECPNAAFLWCAKEAYFKSLAQDQPQAITQLNISDWRQIDPGVHSFIASPHKPGMGWIVEDGPLLYGVCLV